MASNVDAFMAPRLTSSSHIGVPDLEFSWPFAHSSEDSHTSFVSTRYSALRTSLIGLAQTILNTGGVHSTTLL